VESSAISTAEEETEFGFGDVTQNTVNADETSTARIAIYKVSSLLKDDSQVTLKPFFSLNMDRCPCIA
jgi:hypothetical protein